MRLFCLREGPGDLFGQCLVHTWLDYAGRPHGSRLDLSRCREITSMPLPANSPTRLRCRVALSLFATEKPYDSGKEKNSAECMDARPGSNRRHHLTIGRNLLPGDSAWDRPCESRLPSYELDVTGVVTESCWRAGNFRTE